MDNDKALREHLLDLLKAESAHISLQAALSDFPVEHMNSSFGRSPHTAWQLLEHIRLAQRDILEFSIDPNYKEKVFPDDYWPADEGTEADWNRSVDEILADLRAMSELVADENTDLYAKIPHGSGQTILREAMLIADHNAYHLGQIMLIRKSLT